MSGLDSAGGMAREQCNWQPRLSFHSWRMAGAPGDGRKAGFRRYQL